MVDLKITTVIFPLDKIHLVCVKVLLLRFLAFPVLGSVTAPVAFSPTLPFGGSHLIQL
jgi:hypothetical protein